MFMTTLLSAMQGHIYIWKNVFFYLFILAVFCIVLLYRKITQKTNELSSNQQQHSAKIDRIRDDHAQTLEKIRGEMLKKEEERTRQWMESEKETLHVLNGVSQVLELSENISRVESEKIINKLDEIKTIVEKKNGNHEKNGETQRS